MAFPRIQTKATSFELTPALTSLLEQKLTPLERLIPDHETIRSCEVELGKVAEQQAGKIYRVEVNLTVEGKLYRAVAVEEQIEHAVDVVRDELKAEIRKTVEKERSLFRRGRRAIKRMMRMGE